MPANVSLIVTLGHLGQEAVVDPGPGIEIRNWDTNDPFEGGIEGMERMCLIPDDLRNRTSLLANELHGSTTG